jgi:hypothetical protein
MIPLPGDPGVIVVGSCLRDPGEIPWGRGVPLAAPHPHGPCTNCGGSGWLNDPYFGATLGTPCPACRDAS